MHAKGSQGVRGPVAQRSPRVDVLRRAQIDLAERISSAPSPTQCQSEYVHSPAAPRLPAIICGTLCRCHIQRSRICTGRRARNPQIQGRIEGVCRRIVPGPRKVTWRMPRHDAAWHAPAIQEFPLRPTTPRGGRNSGALSGERPESKCRRQTTRFLDSDSLKGNLPQNICEAAASRLP